MWCANTRRWILAGLVLAEEDPSIAVHPAFMPAALQHVYDARNLVAEPGVTR
jgi:hypothetical protein